MSDSFTPQQSESAATAQAVERSPWRGDRRPWTDQGEGSVAPGYERRQVEVEDPSLSPGVNHRLTDELRQIVGATEVVVPVDRAHPSHGDLATAAPAAAKLSTSRLFIALTLLAAATIGAIVSLSTNNWWFLALALGLHALGTTLMAGMIIRMTTDVEHPDPATLAWMEEEGVAHPEERFTEIVGEFAGSDAVDTGSTATDVVSPGRNSRTADSLDDPATAAAEQRSAMSPTAAPSEPSPLIGAAPLMTWIVPAILILFSIAIPLFFGGGWMWVTTAVVVPLCLAWAGLQVLMDRHVGPFKEKERPRIFVPAVIALSAASMAIVGVVIALVFTDLH